MRILHTSDWHLGRAFHREPMLGHQAAFIDHLMEVVTAEAVDVVVVSGDVYDKALPPVDAVRLADEAIARLAASPAALVLISGNHDSPHRLGFGAAVMERAGVHVRTRPAAVAEPVLVEDRHGPVEFYAIPYLDPAAWAPVWELGERSHAAVLAEAMRRIRTRRRTGTTPRWCVAAHASVTGGCATDSERDISVGGIDHVSASVFADAHYAALGHLHRPQQLRDTIRYSGSPLAYSFSEAGQVKGCWLVDLAGDGSLTADFVPAPVPRALARLRGDLADLLTHPELAQVSDCWVEVVLTDAERPARAMERLRSRFPHTLMLSFSPRDPISVGGPTTRPAGHDPQAMIGRFVVDMRGRAPSADEAALLATAWESAAEVAS